MPLSAPRPSFLRILPRPELAIVLAVTLGVQIVDDVSAQTGPTDKEKPGPVELQVSSQTALGEYIVDSKGRSVYAFEGDRPGESVCYDKCVGDWPPLLTSADPKGAKGVDAAKIGTAKRKDGTTQVTYNQRPLYYFKMDQGQPGATTGQAIVSHSAMWYLLSPNGEKITAKRAGEFPEPEKLEKQGR